MNVSTKVQTRGCSEIICKNPFAKLVSDLQIECRKICETKTDFS